MPIIIIHLALEILVIVKRRAYLRRNGIRTGFTVRLEYQRETNIDRSSPIVFSEMRYITN